jgi:hypothetical protein
LKGAEQVSVRLDAVPDQRHVDDALADELGKDFHE